MLVGKFSTVMSKFSLSVQFRILSLTSPSLPYPAVSLNEAFVKIKLKKVHAKDSVDQKIYNFF